MSIKDDVTNMVIKGLEEVEVTGEPRPPWV